MRTRRSSILLLLGLLMAAGCQRAADKRANTEAPGETMKDYPITGRVVSITPDKSAITIDHEDIPGLMPAMQMQFTVEDAKILAGIEPGNEIEGRLKVDGGKYTVTELKTR